MFKKILFILLVSITSYNLQAWSVWNWFNVKPKLDIDGVFQELNQYVADSENPIAQKALENFNQQKALSLKKELEEASASQIKDIVFQIKCGLVPPAYNWATSRARAEYALKHPSYRDWILYNHPRLIDEQIAKLKTCSDVDYCENVLNYLFVHLLFKDLIRK